MNPRSIQSRVSPLLYLTCLFAAACSDSHDHDHDASSDATVDAAQDASSDGSTDGQQGQCSQPSDCALAPESCCGTCGAPERGDVVALRKDEIGDHQQAACDAEGNPGCPGCEAQEDPTLFATCDAGTCVVVDLHEHPAAQCDGSGQCVLRVRDCCACGASTGPENVIAIRTDSGAAYNDLVCDPLMSCTACEPIYDPRSMASCNIDDGHCQVTWALD